MSAYVSLKDYWPKEKFVEFQRSFAEIERQIHQWERRHTQYSTNYRLCDFCSSVLQEFLSGTQRSLFRFFHGTEEFTASADSCSLCRLALTSLRASGLPADGVTSKDSERPLCSLIDDGAEITWTDEGPIASTKSKPSVILHAAHIPPIWESFIKAPGPAYLLFSLQVQFSRVEKELFHNRLMIFGRNGLTTSTGPIPIAQDPRLKAEGKLCIADRWLRDELQRNDRIPEILEWPRRLLRLVPDHRVTLVNLDPETWNHGTCPRYVALSHRWGDNPSLTYDSKLSCRIFDGGLEIEEFPKTFRDAIFVTRMLGFSYLWIDALCIQQHDLHSKDWLQESHKMGDIFQRASLTIAAHCAKNDSDGFLAQALSTRPVLEHYVNNQGIGTCELADAESEVNNSELSKRGWVLQERLRSTRMIHFCASQVSFESSGPLISEEPWLNPVSEHGKWTGKRFTPYRSEISTLRRLFSQYSFAERDIDWNMRTTTPMKWLDLIQIYSECRLTEERDKLIAIAGMASKLQKVTGQSWCAGLWADTIHRELLWLRASEHLVEPQKLRAPSWSWAAWDGTIQYPVMAELPSLTPLCQFVSVRNLKHKAVSWLEAPGNLVIRGTLWPLTNMFLSDEIQMGSGKSQVDIAQDVELRYRIHAFQLYQKCDSYSTGWIVLDKVEADFVRKHFVSIENILENKYVGFEDRSPSALFDRGQQTWFLPLGSCVERESCLGIFLVMSKEHSTMYRRIGMGAIRKLCFGAAFFPPPDGQHAQRPSLEHNITEWIVIE